MLFWSKPYETRTQEWRASQVKRLARLFRCQLQHARLPLTLGQLTEIDQIDFDLRRWSNKLGRFTIGQSVISTQDLVTPDEFVQRAPQRFAIERTGQTHGRRNVVCGRARFQLIEEPQTLLRERQREIAIARYGNDRRCLQTAFSAQRSLNRCRLCGERCRLEEEFQRQIGFELRLRARDKLRHQQRVSAEFEEVIVNTYAFDLQHIGPNA